MKVIDCQQGSTEWREARLGVPTASQFHRIVTPTGKLSTQREGYMAELLAEWALGAPDDEFNSEWMQRGNILEPYAFKAYAFLFDAFPSKVGFCLTDDALVGCSPDALVGEDGGLELKCPKAGTHLIYLFRDKVPNEYFCQVQASMWITGRPWWDFGSYYPELPFFVKRSTPDEKYHKGLDEHIPTFVAELEEGKKRLVEMGVEPIMEDTE